MQRRTALAGAVTALSSLAGCLSSGYQPEVGADRTRWSRTVDADPDDGSPVAITTAGDTVLASVDGSLFAFGRDGGRRWTGSFDRATQAARVDGGFVVATYPGYHPRNYNRPTFVRLSPAGNIEWRHGTARHSGVAVGTDRLVVTERPQPGATGTDERWHVRSVDLASGERQWRIERPGRTYGPRIVGDTVVTVSGSSLVGFDLASGAVRWTFDEWAVEWPPAVADGTVSLTRHRGSFEVVRIDPATGAVRGRYAVADADPYSPLSVGSGFGVANGRRDERTTTYGIDPETGRRRWSNVYDPPLLLSERPGRRPAVGGSQRLVFDTRGFLRALDPTDGSVQWSFGSPVPYPVAVADGSTVYMAVKATVLAIDA